MLQGMLRTINHLYSDHGWMMQVFLIVLSTLIIHMLFSFAIKRLNAKVKKTKNFIDESLIAALSSPSICIIWLLGICFAAEVAGSAKDSPIFFSYLPYFRAIGLLALSTWFFMRFIRMLEANYIKRAEEKNKSIDKTLVHALAQLLTISTLITVVLIGMQLFGVPISGLLAFGGIGGAGIAFASKDLLANFFGGIILYLDRPFKVGDFIRSPDRHIEGTVEQIGWRLTRLRTFDKRPLYVPNGVFLTISVENLSRMTNRCIKTLVGVRYDDALKIKNISKDIKDMLLAHPEIDTKHPTVVNLVEFAASSLNILVYTYTKTTQRVKFQEIQQDVFLKIIDIIDAHEAQCAFPTSTVYTPDLISLNQ